AKISIERMGELFEEEEEKSEDAFSEEAVSEIKDIKIENLSFKYNALSSNYILNNINIVIPAGKVTAIVGTSGSGKTSFLNLLLKFYEQQEGRIYYGNTD